MSRSARPEHAIGVLFEAYAAATRVDAFLTNAFGDLDLKPVGYAILSIVATTGGATPGDIAQATGARPSTLSGHLAKLTSHGWLDREEGEDRRVAVLALTPEGRRVHALAERRVARRMARLRAELDTPIDTVRQALRDLSVSLERVMNPEAETPGRNGATT